MNFYEALTCAVKDGKKIRQTDWTQGVYATADETGQLHLYNKREDDNDRVTASYWTLGKADWEIYTRSARFEEVNIGDIFKLKNYPANLIKVKNFRGYNAIRDDGCAVTIRNGSIMEIIG